MNKVELAKMIGLYKTGYEHTISKHDILNLLEHELMVISETFCGNIEVEIEQEDLLKGWLSVLVGHLKRGKDVESRCIKQIEDLLWERAADKYLEMIHNAAMRVGR